MGASVFMTESNGKTARDAFNAAVQEAAYNYGHAGYTGTIAEKESFVMIPSPPEGQSLEDYMWELIDQSDDRIDDKWGPAGCIQLSPEAYMFFGWASN